MSLSAAARKPWAGCATLPPQIYAFRSKFVRVLAVLGLQCPVGFSLVSGSRDAPLCTAQAPLVGHFSRSEALALGLGLSRVVHGLRIFPDQESNPRLLHRRAASLPLAAPAKARGACIDLYFVSHQQVNPGREEVPRC